MLRISWMKKLKNKEVFHRAGAVEWSKTIKKKKVVSVDWTYIKARQPNKKNHRRNDRVGKL